VEKVDLNKGYWNQPKKWGLSHAFLSHFFVKKIPLSWRVGYVMDGSMDE